MADARISCLCDFLGPIAEGTHDPEMKQGRPMLCRVAVSAPALGRPQLCCLAKDQAWPCQTPMAGLGRACTHPAQQRFWGAVCPLGVPAVWQEHRTHRQLPDGRDP